MTKIDVKFNDKPQANTRRLTLWDLNIGDFFTTDEEPNSLRRVWNKTEMGTAAAAAMVTAMGVATDYKWTNKLEAQCTLVTRYNRIVLEVLEPQTTIGDTNG